RLKVTLQSPIQPIGEFGYFYEGHVQLSKGSKVFNFNIEDVQISGTPAQMLVTKTTLIKAQPVDSANLSSAQKAELLLGKTLGITGYACTSGHFRVTLSESIPGFGNVGYVYWQHVQIKNRDQVVSYDSDALTATIRETTALKKQPVDAARLSATEKVTLPLGRVYGVASYAIESGHLKASLTEEFPGFGNTGYLFPGHLLMQRGGRTFDPVPNQIELNVPYFSQRDNPRYYWSTCNVTSIAMVFHYYGLRSKYGGQLEDELLQWCFNYGGVGSQTDHSVLSAMVRAYGFKHRFITNSTWSEVKNELINRRPVVIAGYFTATGHIITIIGYNRQGFIVQDPWGDALTGYSHTEGRRLMYPYSYMDRVCGPDGNVWIHSIQK
ncbi:MAG TPA: C39 family peptidase, partial [Vampirovibrionales bacterium]